MLTRVLQYYFFERNHCVFIPFKEVKFSTIMRHISLVQLQVLKNNYHGYVTSGHNYRNFASSIAFGDFQFKGKEKCQLKPSYDVVIVGAGAHIIVI